MAQCMSCSAQIPDGQNTCSMCYGDPDHGSDGYYQDMLDDDLRRQQERAQDDAEYGEAQRELEAEHEAHREAVADEAYQQRLEGAP